MKRRFYMRCINGARFPYPREGGADGMDCSRFSVLGGDCPRVLPKCRPIVIDSDGSIREIGPEHTVPISSGCRLYVDGSVFVVDWRDGADLPMPPLPGPSAIELAYVGSVERGPSSQPADLPQTKTRFTAGVKSDFGKVRGTLVPADAEAWVARVMEYGAEKYEVGNWLKLSDEAGRTRIVDALKRHLDAIRMGETFDSDTKMPHVAAIACNAAFLLHFGYLSGEPGWNPFKLTAEQIQALRDAPSLGKMAK